MEFTVSLLTLLMGGFYCFVFGYQCSERDWGGAQFSSRVLLVLAVWIVFSPADGVGDKYLATAPLALLFGTWLLYRLGRWAGRMGWNEAPACAAVIAVVAWFAA